MDYGFRLPCAFDNRPLKFEEFEQRLNQVVYVSATPGEYERDALGPDRGAGDPAHRACWTPGSRCGRVEGQIDDLIGGDQRTRAQRERAGAGHHPDQADGGGPDRPTSRTRASRCAICTHDIDTIERMEIIRDLRLGTFDVLVGINLLREGLDLPEVSLVAILDADKEGFLRSARPPSSRPSAGPPGTPTAWWSCTPTPSPPPCAGPSTRRSAAGRSRTPSTRPTASCPRTVIKSVRELLEISATSEDVASNQRQGRVKAMTRQEKAAEIARLEKAMKEAAKMLEFELAATLRDQIIELRGK